MPFLDGMEATKEILEYEEDYNQPHVPILALTANALKGDRERFLEAGLDEYTTKPLVRSEIISLLNHFLSDHIVDEPIMPNSATELKELQETQENEEIEVPEILLETTLEEETINKKSEEVSYKTDVLLAKKSHFESKLFTKILDSLNYSYEVINDIEALQEALTTNSYKVVLLDNECSNLNLESISKLIKSTNESRTLDSKLVLIADPSSVDLNVSNYVDETIKNVVNRDLLRLVIEKFI